MPKITYLDKRGKRLNYLRGLLTMYRESADITSAQISEEIGYAPDSIRRKIAGPVENWHVVDLIRVCDFLGIPMEEAIEAVRKSM